MKVNTKHGKKIPAVELNLPLYCPKTAISGGKSDNLTKKAGVAGGV